MRAVAPAPADGRDNAKRGDHHEQAQQDAGRDPEPAERQRDQLDDAEADREQHDHQQDDQQDPAHAREDAGGGGGDEQPHRAQGEHLAAARRGLAEALDGVLEVARAAFGERQRGIGHAPDLHPLLRARGGDRALEVAARGVGVEALGGARAEDRQRGGLVFGLGLELLVGALLERLDRLDAAALFDADLSLFGCHGGSFYGLRAERQRASPRRDAGGMSPTCSPPRRSSPCAASLSVAVLRAGAGAARRPATLGGRLGAAAARSANWPKAPTETTPTETTATTATTATEHDTNSKGTILLAVAAAIVLLGGIAFVIVRDARRVAPATDGQLAEGRSGHDPAVMMRKRRAKAKAARQQRKRNSKRGRVACSVSLRGLCSAPAGRTRVRIRGGRRERRRAVRAAAREAGEGPARVRIERPAGQRRGAAVVFG